MGIEKQISLVIEPTRDELIEKATELSRFEKKIVNMVATTNENLFSFLCGIITNIPISVLFSILSISIDGSLKGWLILCLYVTLLGFSTLLSVCSIKFTVRYIEMRNRVDQVKNREAYNNIFMEKALELLPRFVRSLRCAIAFASFTVITVIALFVINNLL